jgi:hypothetical protein
MYHNFRRWKLKLKEKHSTHMFFYFYTLSFTWSLCSWKLFHVSSNSHRTSCLPFSIPFNWCNIVLTLKLINDWTFDSTCLVGVWNICKPLFPWSKNLHFHLESTCITCMSIWSIQWSYTMPFHKILFLESW